jgi:hypothetical protein
MTNFFCDMQIKNLQNRTSVGRMKFENKNQSQEASVSVNYELR